MAMTIAQSIGSVIGYGIKRYRHEAERQKLELRLQTLKERNETMERDRIIARQMHDELTNDLTYIITVAETRLMDADGVEQETLNKLSDRAKDALDCAHQAIDMLRHKDYSSLDEQINNTTLWDEIITGIIQRNRLDLAQMGYNGTVSIQGIEYANSYGKKVCDEVCSLLQELFFNIRKHCSRQDGDYSLSIEVNHTFLNIIQMNSIASIPSLTQSNRGLAIHRDIIGRLGGTFTTSAEDGTWILKVAIPSPESGSK
ncbi:histidine kinase [Bifidobacterium sp. DSM 109957]|uniref:Histidine kinase n=2 Tax=Bifidobacterium oedipodis TaxID=2675322 RepID=A0A7Y0EQ17_9BIFI|nr:histidine kinase [Bifidobacterium sp. DSM 109957]